MTEKIEKDEADFGVKVVAGGMILIGFGVMLIVLPLARAFGIYWTWKLLLPWPITWMMAAGLALFGNFISSSNHYKTEKRDIDWGKVGLSLLNPFLVAGIAFIYAALFG